MFSFVYSSMFSKLLLVFIGRISKTTPVRQIPFKNWNRVGGLVCFSYPQFPYAQYLVTVDQGVALPTVAEGTCNY